MHTVFSVPVPILFLCLEIQLLAELLLIYKYVPDNDLYWSEMLEIL
jgi:hypothetical protein